MATKYADRNWTESFYDLGQGNDYCRLFYKIGVGGSEEPAITGKAIDGSPDAGGNYNGPNTAVEVVPGSGLYLYNGVASWLVPTALIGEENVYLIVRDKVDDDVPHLEYGPYDIIEAPTAVALESSISTLMTTGII